MARPRKQILPFRIPFFRIFYSTTYTTLWAITLVLLAITPASLLYTAIQNKAWQYIFMIGGVYILTALLTVFIYTSRLYTNRSVLAGIGKAYIPIEHGEVSRSVRKLIVSQLERSAVIAWEARPRDLEGEIIRAEREGFLPQETESLRNEDYTVGTIITIDPAYLPWGHVQHPGWTAPAQAVGKLQGNLQFATVIHELPNLIEARAVSLAPPGLGELGTEEGQPIPDPTVVDALRRQEKMGLREYLTQLTYLGLVNPPYVGHEFLDMYEEARFSGMPSTEEQFNGMMNTFAQLLEGMTELDPAIIMEIRAQTSAQAASSSDQESMRQYGTASSIASDASFPSQRPPHSISSAGESPVTARTRPSRAATPYLQQFSTQSVETLGSVVIRSPEPQWAGERVSTAGDRSLDDGDNSSLDDISVALASDAGSVVRYDVT